MIDALHDRPGRSRRAGGNRSGLRPSPVERFDRQPVIGLGDEPFVERRALEHVRHQPAPLFARGGGKLGSKGKVVGRGVRHGHKMPRCWWRANYKPLARPRSVRKRASSELGWILGRALSHRGDGGGRPRAAGDHGRGGSFSTPLASTCASASRTRRPAISRSGAISASGANTNARPKSCGCGSVRSGSCKTRSS